jgi:hypothetical protein
VAPQDINTQISDGREFSSGNRSFPIQPEFGLFSNHHHERRVDRGGHEQSEQNEEDGQKRRGWKRMEKESVIFAIARDVGYCFS